MNIDTLLKHEFQLKPGLIYLNHAAVSPWPQRTAISVKNFAYENANQGSENYLQWIETETQLRQQMASLINAPDPNDIALLKNTSEALSVVAYGLDWQAGDNVVISDQEFPSNRVVWESLKSLGIEVRKASIDMAASEPERSLIAACDRHTRLLSISSIQYATGFRTNLEHLGQHCKTNNILFCVDAIQSIGAVQFDAQAIHADFVMADGHKWMMGPEAVALFYSRPEVREQLKLHQYGWHMLEDMTDYDNDAWQVTRSARRFECGSPNMTGIHALSASLSLLLEIGMENVEQRVMERADKVIDVVNKSVNLSVATETSRGHYGGIIAISHKNKTAEACYDWLKQLNVSCAARGGYIRFSPHCYTTLSDIEQAVELLDKA